MECPYCKYELAPMPGLEPYEYCNGLCSAWDNVYPILQWSDYHQQFVIIHFSWRDGGHLYRLTISPLLKKTFLVALKYPHSKFNGPETTNYPITYNSSNKVFEFGFGRQLIHPYNDVKELLVFQIPQVRDYTPQNVRSKINKLLLFT